ncbi:MAG: alkaline phosphatase PhoX [Pseudomonadota bacterium]
MDPVRQYLSQFDKPSPLHGINRRGFMKAGAASVAFGALAQNAMANNKELANGEWFWRRPFSPDYGPLHPTRDLATGLELLALPEGFNYLTYGWTGQQLIDGQPTPEDHDGMAVVARQGARIVMVRNHELSASERPRAVCEDADYNPNEAGGTTNLVFNLLERRFEASWCSLSGTIRNCAGGPTPWGTWLSCEETFHPFNSRDDGFNHGYIFDVPGFGVGSGRPIRDAGRFSHEATATDPRTGYLYETEDARPAGLYQYRPKAFGAYATGGDLYALAVVGEPGKDMRVSFENGQRFHTEWIKVDDPEGMEGRPLDSAPGAALFSRLEGCWYDRGLVYFVSTDGGDNRHGQVYTYDPRRETMTMLFESPAAEVTDGPDNIAISPRGGILLCEDGDNDPQRLIGLTPNGETFPFAENRIVLSDSDLGVLESIWPGVASAEGAFGAGNYTGREWAGATFFGNWLFVNIQTPGLTIAITGPWRRGRL